MPAYSHIMVLLRPCAAGSSPHLWRPHLDPDRTQEEHNAIMWDPFMRAGYPSRPTVNPPIERFWIVAILPHRRDATALQPTDSEGALHRPPASRLTLSPFIPASAPVATWPLRCAGLVANAGGVPL